MTARKIISSLHKNRGTLKSYGLKNIGLFGSYARNQQKKNSDVDLLIEFMPGQKTFDHFMDLKFYLRKTLGLKVDLVLKESLKPQLRLNILRDVIYAKL